MIRPVALLLLSTALLGANTAARAVTLPGAAILETSVTLRRASISLGRYPTAVQARFPSALVSRVSISKIPVYLPRVLPAAAPAFTRVAAAPGLYRLELNFTANCETGAHFCHYATLLSKSVITPPADAQPMTYKGVAMFYHAPICSVYCTDAGLYFRLEGVWHAIEARGQLRSLENLYDSYAKVQ